VVPSIFLTFVYFFPVLIPGKIPLMILSNATLFPGAILPLHIFEPRYRRMLSDVLESHRMFAIAMRRPGTRREVPMPVACLGVVRVCVGAPDGTSNLLLLGLKRIQCVGAARYKPYRVERVEPLDSTGEEAPEVSGLRDRLLTMVKDGLDQGMNGDLPSALPGMMLQSPVAPPDTVLSGMTAKNGMDILKKLDTAHRLADFVASTLLRNPLERQVVLESLDIKTRLVNVSHFLSMEIERNNMGPEGYS
jgi:ATP-dependent Lon protease